MKSFKDLLQSEEYSFLWDNPHLGDNIAMLVVSGSYAYGTNVEDSDVDLRGCALITRREILTHPTFEQITDNKTDSVIYAFPKMVKLIADGNPNMIELLGCRPEDYIFLSDVGKELIINQKLFLSKKVYNTFFGYANAQLRRLENKANQNQGQSENEKHLLKTIQSAFRSFPERYFEFPTDSIRLYIDKSIQEDYDTEIFMDVNLTHYPLRDYRGMIGEMQSIVKAYSKIGRRNEYALTHDKIGKHMMHLIRLLFSCIDILEKEEVITYREKEHDLLMDIRNGKFLDKNDLPIPEFYDLVNGLEKKMDYAMENTNLPGHPNYKEIDDFVASVNEKIVMGRM